MKSLRTLLRAARGIAVSLAAGATRADETPRLDRHGDPLPPGAVARMGTIRFRTGNHVNAIAWAPNGKLLAAAGEGKFIHIWDPASAKEVARLPTLANRVHCLTFSPDGKWLAVTGDYSAINLWDASQFGKQDKPRQIAGHEPAASSLAFAPDTKTLYSCGPDGSIRVWDVATGQELRRLKPGEGQWSACIALDRDGKLLVSRDIGRDGNSFQTVATTLWNPATGERIRQLGKTERATSFSSSYSAVFAPDGRTVATVSDEETKLWNVATGAEVAVLKVRCARIAFAPDGDTLHGIGYGDGRVHQWAVPSGRLLRSFATDRLYECPLALSPDGKTIATGRPIVALWDVETGKPRHSWPGHDTAVWSLFFLNGDKELLTTSFDSAVYRWDLEGRLLGQWKPPLGQYKQPANCFWTTAALSPDGKTLAIQNTELRALLVDPLTGQVRQSFNNHQDQKWRHERYFPMQFAFSPDSRRVVSAAGGVDQHVRLWETDTAKELWNLKTGKPDTLIQGFALSPDGQTMYLTGDAGPVKVYEVGKAAVQRRIGAAKAVIRSLCLSRDGRRLAGAESENIVIWDTATGAEVCRLPRPHVSEMNNRRFMKFSPDGRMLALWSNEEEPTVRCLEIASGQVRLQTAGHLEMVLGVEFSADGRHLATGSTDTTALLWDLRELALVGDTAKNVDPEKLWSELASPDAKIAHRATVRLQQLGPKAAELLADRLKPVANRPLAAWIAELDNEDFRVRERATEELSGRTADIRGELAQALAATKSAEVRGRIQGILDKLGEPRKDVRRLRSLRGLETLEGIGTPQARRIVETLSRGAVDAELTLEAAAALSIRRRHGA